MMLDEENWSAEQKLDDVKQELENRRVELEIDLKRVKKDKNSRPWEAEKIEARIQEILRITRIVNA